MSGIISYTAFGGKSGLINKPPYFKCRGNAEHLGSDTGEIHDWVYVEQNGSQYDNSTGRFTAPINGVYYFAAHVMKNNYQLTARFYLQKNNTRPASDIDSAFQMRLHDEDSSVAGGQYTMMGLSGLFQLDAGEYVSLYTSTGYLINDTEYNSFLGTLWNV